MTGQHRHDDHHGPGFWVAAFALAVLVLCCMGVWRMWIGP